MHHSHPAQSRRSARFLHPTLVFAFLLTLTSIVSASIRFDFDGDGRADLGVFRPSNGVWYLQQSMNGFSYFQFGQDGDLPVAEDYDGDGKTDAAVYRGGVWYLLKSGANTFEGVQFGIAGDVPTPADYDGDHRVDIAVFRPSTGQWFRILTASNSFTVSNFGVSGDEPVPGDFDGDGKADITVFRPTNGNWYLLGTANGGSFTIRQFGELGDIPVAADFDGDARSDYAVWRPSNNNWYIQGSRGTFAVQNFGELGDRPVPADYDGDDRADIAVYRPENGSWYRINSESARFEIQSFGLVADIPVASRIIPRATPTPTPSPTATPFLTPSPTPVVTPTPSPTATPTPVSAPSPTPTPFPTPTPTSSTCDYFASPSGTMQGNGSLSSPWDLSTALSKSTIIVSGKTLCLRGGTYFGKFVSNLNGGTVRSYPGEWAVLDGNFTTTLVHAINATQSVFDVSDASQIATTGSNSVWIGGEVIGTYTRIGNTITTSLRGGNGTTAVPHDAGTSMSLIGSQFTISGNNTIYRDFEVTNSSPVRDTALVGGQVLRGNGVVINGASNKFINLIVHDNANGFQSQFSLSSNTEIYGCLIFNNGMYAGNTAKGHGLYLQNSEGYSRVYDVISINNFNYGMQGYGTAAAYFGGDVRGSVFANNGSPMNFQTWSLLIGAEAIQSPSFNLQDSHFYAPPASSGGGRVGIGYGAGVASATVNGNYFTGSSGLNISSRVPYANGSNNTFFGEGTWGNFFTLFPPASLYSWDRNTYYNVGNGERYQINSVGNRSFPDWKSQTRYDANSSQSLNPMPTTVVIRPNAYETGRANIIIHAPSGPSTIDVNLATTGLRQGQGYTIRNAFNYWGPNVISGTYNATSPTITLPLTGAAATVARPVGMTTTPASTCPKFCSLVLIPR